MPEVRTTLVVPMFSVDDGMRITDNTRRLQEMVITGRDPSQGDVIAQERYLETLEFLNRIHRPTADAVARVLAAALHVHHFRLDHATTVTGQRSYSDSRMIDWGHEKRSVAALFSSIGNIVPQQIAQGLPAAEVSSEQCDTDVAVVAHAMKQVRERLLHSAFFIGEYRELVPEVCRELNNTAAPNTLFWDTAMVRQHFVQEHGHTPNQNEQFLLDAINIVKIYS